MSQIVPTELKYCIGRSDSYSSWKTNPALQLRVFDGLTALLSEQFSAGRKPDIVVCHGSSSIFACVPLIQFLHEHGVHLFHLRKAGENAHGQEFEGPRLERRPEEGHYVAWFIDDMIATGITANRVHRKLANYNCRLDTIVLYADGIPRLGPAGVRVLSNNFLDQS